MDVFGCFKLDHSYMNEPSNLVDYFTYLDGRWRDYSPFTVGGNGQGGTVHTNYLFSGNPNNPGEWSEIDEGLSPGERKMFMGQIKDL